MKKIYLLALAVIGFSANSLAQVTATATATATIITPISISNTLALQFKNIAVNGVAGTVSVDAITAVRAATGGVTLPGGGLGQTANFVVAGSVGTTYSISIPGLDGVTLSNGVAANDMKMTPSCSIGLGAGSLASGTETFYVGGTLKVAASQLAGSYTGTFNVAVIYN